MSTQVSIHVYVCMYIVYCMHGPHSPCSTLMAAHPKSDGCAIAMCGGCLWLKLVLVIPDDAHPCYLHPRDHLQ